MFVEGIPSIIAPSDIQGDITVEQDANTRALAYFLEYYPDEFIEEGKYTDGWDFEYNGINAFDSYDYHTENNQSVLASPPIQPYIDLEASRRYYNCVLAVFSV